MLKSKAEGAETGKILRELRETMTSDRREITRIEKKQEEERKALEQLREKAEYYRQALDMLGT